VLAVQRAGRRRGEAAPEAAAPWPRAAVRTGNRLRRKQQQRGRGPPRTPEAAVAQSRTPQLLKAGRRMDGLRTLPLRLAGVPWRADVEGYEATLSRSRRRPPQNYCKKQKEKREEKRLTALQSRPTTLPTWSHVAMLSEAAVSAHHHHSGPPHQPRLTLLEKIYTNTLVR
jgi:hypothetical protein